MNFEEIIANRIELLELNDLRDQRRLEKKMMQRVFNRLTYAVLVTKDLPFELRVKIIQTMITDYRIEFYMNYNGHILRQFKIENEV